MSITTSSAADAAAPAVPWTSAATNDRATAAAWYALAILVVATVLGGVDKVVFTLLAEPMRRTLALSDTQLGMLQGAGLALFAGLATLPLGWLSDRYDRRRILAACIVLWSAATALRGLAPNYAVMFVGAVGLGVGEAGLVPITNSLIPDLFPRTQRVLANAVFGLAAIFGNALGALLAGMTVALIDGARGRLPAAIQPLETWRLAYLAVAAAGVPVAILMLCTRRTSAGRTAAEAGALACADYLRANWRTLGGIVVGVGMASVGLTAIGSWLPIIAARRFGATPSQLGQGMALAFLAGTVAGAVLGVGAMRVAQRRLGPAASIRVLALGCAAAACLSVLLLFVRSAAEVYAMLALMVTPLVGATLVAPNVLQEVSPAHLRARVLALLTVASLPFAVLVPLAIGALSDRLGAATTQGLTIAVVAASTATGALGALVLRATEARFARTVSSLDASR